MTARFLREHFTRVDESDDGLFYTLPRLVTHIDEAACAALAAHYHRLLPAAGDILDLMSSWVSHLPEKTAYRSVTGLGMNQAELDANPRLTKRVIHDLNRETRLPFADDCFDACTIAVSIQYLTNPVAVMRDIARVLRPGAPCTVVYSNRCFPTKAVAIWRAIGDADHAQLIGLYFVEAGGFEAPEFEDLSPAPGESDPLYAVSARRAMPATEGGASV